MPDDVQPAEGQGADGTDSGLYDLDSVDPEIRDQLTPHLKAIEGNVTKKFQEAAEERKQWQPYEELGLKDMNPEAVKQLLDFAQLAQNPEQFAQWWKTAGEEMDLFEKDELDLEDLEDLDKEKIQELVEKQVSEKLNPIQEKIQTQEQERLAQKAEAEIASKLEGIRKDNPDLPEGAEDMIVRLAYSYADEEADAVAKGFEDYQSLIGQGEKSLFEKKAQQPTPAEGPGAASTSPEKITSFSDPRLTEMATERLRKSLSS